LAAKLSRSLTQLIKHEPRPGWIRADSATASGELEILKLRQENAKLRERLQRFSAVAVDPTELASGDEVFEVEFHCETQVAKTGKNGNRYWVNSESFWHTIEFTWDGLFLAIIPALTSTTTESDTYRCLNNLFREQFDPEALKKENAKISQVLISRRCGEQIRMQFSALGYISVRTADYKLLWEPTEKGLNQIVKLGALKKGETRAKAIRAESELGSEAEPEVSVAHEQPQLPNS
jgi:hypothetical protein